MYTNVGLVSRNVIAWYVVSLIRNKKEKHFTEFRGLINGIKVNAILI